GRDDLLDLLGEVAGDAGREMVARFGESFTGKFQEQTARPVRCMGCGGWRVTGDGYRRRKLQGRRAGHWVLGFFRSRLLCHEDFLAQIPPNGNGNVRVLAVP
ncbi:MAG: hypothetical protein EBS53_17875, partial [Bacteroidetes bacterium]|nr:hypothetical protein [Bacteroidota bacterium]